MSARKRRVALYSPGIVGLGHMRRHLLIAQALANSPLELVLLLIAEARQAGAFPMTRGLDCLVLPALCREADGQIHPRYLDVPTADAVALRSKTICAALEAFEPDVLVVDKLARGALGELDLTLRSLRHRGQTRCVLGLRDVLDEPEAVERDWTRRSEQQVIRDYFHAVWVYGDPSVYDPAVEYRLPEDITCKLRYSGYLDQRLRLKFADAAFDPLKALDLPAGNRIVLCLVGGGQDGAKLAEAFAAAQLPPNAIGIVVTGPFMPQEVQDHLRRGAAADPQRRVLDFVPEPAVLVDRADQIIAMGGYNTVSEVLSFEKHALIVPRVRPSREQWIRARRLAALGLIDMLEPHELSPAALGEWMRHGPRPLPRARDLIDFDGLTRLPVFLEDVLASSPMPLDPSVKGCLA